LSIGDEEVWEWLEYWRYHDFHLWQYERSLDVKTRGHRNEIYRIEASELADQYGTIVFEDIRLDNMAKGRVAGGNRQLSAPSEFRNACKNATRTRGKGYEEVSAINTSKLHAACGTMNDIGAKMEYHCSGCGMELDRDENAAENILGRWLPCEHSGDAQTTPTARTDENQNELEGLAESVSGDAAPLPQCSGRKKEVLANQAASV
jgi:transposase